MRPWLESLHFPWLCCPAKLRCFVKCDKDDATMKRSLSVPVLGLALAGPLLIACMGVDMTDTVDRTQSETNSLSAVETPELLSFTCRQDPARRSAPSFGANDETLRGTDRVVGVAIAAARLSEPTYAATAAAQFNQLTPENEMKWETIEPRPGVFDFVPADSIVEFAAGSGMRVRGHTLVWHSQLPAWVGALPSPDAVRAALARHIQSVVGHYREAFPGTVIAYDVVNEAIENVGPEARYRDSVFYRQLGEGFIAEAFQLAHAADPDALLFYNDFGIEGLQGAKSTATFDMVSALLAAGVPIHGIGFQMHTGPDDRGPSSGEFQANVARYAELGLAIDITEMDVNLCGIGNNSFSLEAQRFRYNRIVSACLASPGCRSISLWGLGDANSWLNDTGCGANGLGTGALDSSPSPLAFDQKYVRKPAWWGIYDALTDCSY
jgi:endo-1,4-beta-xylanase